jgi:ribosome-associated protein
MRVMSARDDEMKSARQIARSKQRKAGDRSAKLAHQLMQLGAPALKKLELDDDLREAIDRARSVTAHIARRRAERTLAGELRRFDLVALAATLARVHEAGQLDTRDLHLAEHWRARLIEEGLAAAAEFPGGADEELPRLIDAARRERDTGRPPGAARALFRHVVEALKAQRPEPAGDSGAGEDGDGEGDDGPDDGDDDGDDAADRRGEPLAVAARASLTPRPAARSRRGPGR